VNALQPFALVLKGITSLLVKYNWHGVRQAGRPSAWSFAYESKAAVRYLRAI
jgi:hypothetical protein